MSKVFNFLDIIPNYLDIVHVGLSVLFDIKTEFQIILTRPQYNSYASLQFD